MNILVTGGLGFVGSNLCPMLAVRGHRVRILDNLSANAVPVITGLPTLVGDIRDINTVRVAVADNDCIVHLGAMPGVAQCNQNPDAATDVNVGGTVNLLSVAVEQGVKHFVLASSVGAVLGVQEQPANESQTPRPESKYGMTKLQAESLCAVKKELDTVVLRLTNIYGPHSQLKTNVVPKILSLGKGESLTVYGDGNQTRDFVYVDDVCCAIVRAVEQQATGLFHIGSGERTRLLDLVALIDRIKGTKTAINFAPVRPGDVQDNWTSLSRARSELGYNPLTSLGQGIMKTWGWMCAV